jgi:cell division protein FtsL
MATDKRDRQRANREVKRAKEAKVKRRRDAFARIKKWVIYGILIASALLVFTLLTR